MPIRTAMVSFAHVHARGYARQAQENPAIELAAVWDEDPSRGREEAERIGVAFRPSLDDLLGDGRIDAVIVDAPTSMHYDILMRACSAGKHIFTEKALTLTTKEADDVVAAVERSGVVCVVSLPQRSSAETQYARAVVDGGIIGELTAVRGRIGHNGALDRWFGEGNWFRDTSRAGGGALFDLGCHVVDLVRWFGGSPRRVIARIVNTRGVYEIDDNAAAIVEFENRALGTVEASWVQRGGQGPFELYGTSGSLSITGPGDVKLWTDRLAIPGMERVHGAFVPRALPLAAPMPMAQWVRAIEGGAPASITVRDGRNLTELLEAMYRSTSDGRAIDLPL